MPTIGIIAPRTTCRRCSGLIGLLRFLPDCNTAAGVENDGAGLDNARRAPLDALAITDGNILDSQFEFGFFASKIDFPFRGVADVFECRIVFVASIL